MSAIVPANAAEPTVWLWERKPLSVELQKVLVPARLVPDGWLPLLQHLYRPGDRVRFTRDDGAHQHTGTVVQDQGPHLAVDGDTPATAYTLHKTDVRPLVGEPTGPPVPITATAVSPHRHPVLHAERHVALARWDLDAPRHDGWQPQARLSVAVDADIGSGFTATLFSVDQRTRPRGVRDERCRDLDPLVVHHHAARRSSHRALRDCLRGALAVVRAAADRGEPHVLVHFTPDGAATATPRS